MNSLSRFFCFAFCLIALAFSPMNASAATVTEQLADMSEDTYLAPEMDSKEAEKINKKLKKMQKGLCNLKIRPDAVAIAYGLVIVEWSIGRLCGADLDAPVVATETTVINQ